MAIIAALLPALNLGAAGSAQAAYATNGAGSYKGSIDWMQWGSHGTVLSAGARSETVRIIGGQRLVTTCTLDTLVNPLRAYRSGSYFRDALDDLYNVGGTGSNNQLVSGLGNNIDGQTASFHVSCKAELDQVPVKVSGLVMADAETSGSNEYISARPDGTTPQWRLIERFRGTDCTTNIKATLATDHNLMLQPTSAECANGGPTAIAYMEAATGASVTIKGGGATAVALGVVLDSDFGDAPATYGSAGALFQPEWIGSAIPAGTSYVFPGTTPTIGLSTLGQPKTMLGKLIDAEPGYQPSAGADADDAAPIDDEDAIAALGTVTAYPGQTYSVANVACTGPGYLAGWIDWNNNTVFDAGERSTQAQCTGTSVNLSWTVPANVSNTPAGVQSVLRLRIAELASQIALPTGISTTGEVEDHPLRLSVPTVSIQKNVSSRVSATDQFTLSLATAGQTTDTATTAGAATGLQAAKIGPKAVAPGTAFTFQETVATGSASPLSEYDSSYSCTVSYPGGASSVLVANTSGARGSSTVPALDAKGAPTIVCVFGNAPKAASLLVTTVWTVNNVSYANGAQPPGITAQLVQPGIQPAGNVAGNKVGFSQTVSIAEAMPGCTIASQRITNVNGTAADLALSYEQTLKSGVNTAQITNTVTCQAQLTLVKVVEGGTTPATAWTLSAYPATGSAVVTGTTGVKQNVAAGTVLQLAESGGDPRYLQNDERTYAERTAAPRASGSWNCVATDITGKALTASFPARTGANGTFTPTLGSHTSCTAVNRTATLSVLKFVENRNGTGTAGPANWNLTAAPSSGVTGLVSATVAGANQLSAASAIQVRPGHNYRLSEAGSVGGYVQVKLQRFTGADPGNAAALNVASNWTDVDAAAPVSVPAGQHQVYRFVNRDAVRFQLPATGGRGALPYLLVGGVLVAAGLGALLKRRNNHPDTP
ncbi:CshA/CshB family fibrillar adhesin-related protein [Specibacter sp. NPDC057265]|uniref:CshA/CshB family fibrillar adhesin-related protein n=1 Tax=Specibacter sp. NPDC057265 TaxID=3346075 RepID=UPI00362F7943